MVQGSLCGFTGPAIQNRLTGAKWKPSIFMPATSVPMPPPDLPLLTILIFPRCNCRPTGTRDCWCLPASHHSKTVAIGPIISRGSFSIRQEISVEGACLDKDVEVSQVRRTRGIRGSHFPRCPVRHVDQYQRSDAGNCESHTHPQRQARRVTHRGHRKSRPERLGRNRGQHFRGGYVLI